MLLLLVTAMLLTSAPGDAVRAAAAPAGAGPAATALRLVDLTGDGLPDKLHLASGGGLAVSVNQGRGRFALVAQALPLTQVRDVLVTDLDADGHADLYLVSPGENRALLGDGTGRLVDATAALGLADRGAGRSAERIDMDGLAPHELVLHNAGGDVLFWARGGAFVRDPDSTPADLGAGLGAGVAAAAGDLHVLEQILPHLSVLYLDDAAGGSRKTIRFSGVNVQVVNGMRATNGNPGLPYSVDEADTVTNGLGNLIVGYDEARLFGPSDRTGSHNLVLGKEQTYSSFGGLVAGDANRVTAPYSTAAGGYDQTASGLRSAVLGGQENVAAGEGSAVLGGGYNCASGHLATASGGAYNLVPGDYAHVCAGEMNVASGIISCIAGGSDMEAAGVGTATLGGYGGFASGYAATIVGGETNTATGDFASVVGGVDNTAGPTGLGFSGTWAVVLGGRYNLASGAGATIAGGGGDLPVEGNLASGQYSSVSGGRANQATGAAATVGGGVSRAATGDDDWAAGSLLEDG